MVEELLSNKKYRTVRVSEPLVNSSRTKRLWLSLSEHFQLDEILSSDGAEAVLSWIQLQASGRLPFHLQNSNFANGNPIVNHTIFTQNPRAA